MKKSLKEKIRRLIHFINGGVVVFLVQYILTILLTEFFKLHHSLSYAIALGISIFISFHYHAKFTFKEKTDTRKGIKFTIAYIIGSIANWFVVMILANWMHYAIAIPLANAILFYFNYYLYKEALS